MILSCSVRQNLHAFLHIFLSRLTYAFTPSSTLHSGLDPSIPSLLKALYWGEASGGQLSLKTVPILFLYNLPEFSDSAPAPLRICHIPVLAFALAADIRPTYRALPKE